MPDSNPDERMFRCPTCGAVQPWSDDCRRCRCDLGLLHATVQAADALHQQALHLILSGRLDDALQAARQSWELDPSTRSRRLLAVCALLNRQWQSAVQAAVEGAE
ncbi:MAG: hypothetical protein HY000_00815 [Planctomycetes bacterium]|nr:hypothetical protein [Planctomycetota bacterium]